MTSAKHSGMPGPSPKLWWTGVGCFYGGKEELEALKKKRSLLICPIDESNSFTFNESHLRDGDTASYEFITTEELLNIPYLKECAEDERFFYGYAKEPEGDQLIMILWDKKRLGGPSWTHVDYWYNELGQIKYPASCDLLSVVELLKGLDEDRRMADKLRRKCARLIRRKWLRLLRLPRET